MSKNEKILRKLVEWRAGIDNMQSVAKADGFLGFLTKGQVIEI